MSLRDRSPPPPSPSDEPGADAYEGSLADGNLRYSETQPDMEHQAVRAASTLRGQSRSRSSPSAGPQPNGGGNAAGDFDAVWGGDPRAPPQLSRAAVEPSTDQLDSAIKNLLRGRDLTVLTLGSVRSELALHFALPVPPGLDARKDEIDELIKAAVVLLTASKNDGGEDLGEECMARARSVYNITLSCPKDAEPRQPPKAAAHQHPTPPPPSPFPFPAPVLSQHPSP
jgi:hypothetical protein